MHTQRLPAILPRCTLLCIVWTSGYSKFATQKRTLAKVPESGRDDMARVSAHKGAKIKQVESQW